MLPETPTTLKTILPDLSVTFTSFSVEISTIPAGIFLIISPKIFAFTTTSPSSIASAVTTFLEPVVTRFTSAETQRIILLNFIKATADIEDTVELYNVVTFKNEAYNGENGYFANAIEINQNIADNYNYLYNDTTGTSDIYPDWWENLKEQVAQFLINEEVSE